MQDEKKEKIKKVLFSNNKVKSSNGTIHTGIVTKLNIPRLWLKEMGVTEDSEEEKKVKVTYENGKIIIEKYRGK